VPLLKRLIRLLAADTDFGTDACWVVDSTSVECAAPVHHQAFQPRQLGRLCLLRFAISFLLGSATAPDLHPGRVADAWALANPKIDERQVLMARPIATAPHTPLST
jgi:hypothetical protein